MYEVSLTDQIKAVYTPWKGEKQTGCSDSMEITFFVHDIEVTQPDLEAALNLQYESEIWQDLRARQEMAVLDRVLNELIVDDDSEWLGGGLK